MNEHLTSSVGRLKYGKIPAKITFSPLKQESVFRTYDAHPADANSRHEHPERKKRGRARE
jgi:hypothetical protein